MFELYEYQSLTIARDDHFILTKFYMKIVRNIFIVAVFIMYNVDIWVWLINELQT